MEVLGISLDKLWWGICSGLLKIVDWLNQAFFFLVGADTVDVAGNQGHGSNINNLFVNIFQGNGRTTSIGMIYVYIMGGAVIFMGIMFAIGAIKVQFTKDPEDSTFALLKKTGFGLLKMIWIPAVFYVALQGMGYIFTFLIDVMSKGTESTSLAQTICNACYEGTRVAPSFNAEYDKDTMEGFNYLMCILASAFLVVTLVTVCISLVKRIIEVFFYFLTAPIAVCRTPVDDGKSFDLWKENVIAKLLSAGGIIIAMYLYFAILPFLTDAIDVWQNNVTTDADMTTRKVIGSVIKILFVIGGSAVPASASMQMAQLISQGAGQNEANNMMHTQQMMSNAMRVATGALTHGALGALGGGGAVAGKLGSGAVNGAKGATGAMMGASAGGSGESGAFTNSGIARAGATAMAAFGGMAGAGASSAPAATPAPTGAPTPSGAGGASDTAFNPKTPGAQGATNAFGAVSGTPASADTPDSNASSADNRTPSGSSVTNTPSFLGRVGSNVAKSWSGGKTKMRSTSPFLGFAGKIGAGAVVVTKGLAGTALAVPKAVAQSVGSKISQTKGARHLSNRLQERKAGKEIKKDQKFQDKLDARTEGKYKNLDKAMKADMEGYTKNYTSEYMNAKMANYEARANKVEQFLNSQKNWKDERKQEYRRSQLENEANRISAYADVAHGRMNDDSINRYKNFYQKMSKDLYGEDVTKPKTTNEGGAQTV